MSSRCSRSGSERRSAISEASRASAASTSRCSRRKRGKWRRTGSVTPIDTGERVAARMSSSAWRSSSRRRSATPKTAPMITSRVIDCIEECSGNGAPSGQESISCSVASSIARSYARIRSPWNGGSISLRRPRWRSPSSSSSESSPSSGASTMLRPEAIVLTRSAANSAFREGGSEMKTISPTGIARSVKLSPNCRRDRSISATGRTISRSVCSGAGMLGPGGSAMPRIYSANCAEAAGAVQPIG